MINADVALDAVVTFALGCDTRGRIEVDAVTRAYFLCITTLDTLNSVLISNKERYFNKTIVVTDLRTRMAHLMHFGVPGIQQNGGMPHCDCLHTEGS